MQKIKYLLLIGLLIIIGCSGDIDTTNMTPEQKFNVAKERFDKGKTEDALNDFQALQLQYGGTSVSDGVQYYIGMCRFERKEYILGAFEFSKLVKNYPSSPRLVDAQYMLASCYYQLSPHYSLEQKYTKKAIEEFQFFIDNFYQDKRKSDVENKIRELNDKLAEKTFMSAVIYWRMELTKSALIYYDAVMAKYPESKFAEKALYNKIDILLIKARTKEAIDAINKYLNIYPKGNYNEELTDKLNLLKGGLSSN